MTIKLLVTVELERRTGKFESRDSLGEYLADELKSADPGTIFGPENEGEYEVTSFEVEVHPEAK